MRHKHLRPLFFICLLFTSHFFTAAQTRQKYLTVEDIYGSGKFAGTLVRNTDWLTENGKTEALSCLLPGDSTHLWKYDCTTGERSLLLDVDSIDIPQDLKPFRIVHAVWSPDDSRILFTEVLHARRTKTGGNFFLYDLKTRKFTELKSNGEEQSNVQFSPDGSKIGFVRSNNIFVLDLGTGREFQLTNDGAEHVINGHFDWVYEEEFSIIDGWQWSPDGSKIAFWRLDENRVPKYILYNDGPQHAEPIETRYPQPGDSNSVVNIGIVSVAGQKTVWADIGTNDDIYIPRISWTPGGKSLLIERLNRAQNVLEMLSADPATGKTRLLFVEEDNCWIDIADDLMFIDSTAAFVWSSERDGYNHLYLYDQNGSVIRKLTSGKWDVDKCAGIDRDRRLIYFTASTGTPTDRYLYSVSFDGKDMKRISEEEGTHAPTMSPDGRYYIDSYSTISLPTSQILCTAGGKRITEVSLNSAKEALKDYAFGEVRFFTFTTTDSVALNCSMLTPPQFDRSKKYPVLLHVYGGPGSQTVGNNWGGATDLWHQMLAEKGYIVVSVDNRGTGFRGKEFKQIGYKNLGKWEANDYIETAKYLGSLPFVDKERIGIWGWSYGGYMTALTMCLGAEYFKAGIAVAPVTNWMYYDDIYTERYMGTPANNPDGYKASSPITYASRLKGKFLIIHGTNDDNVHMQNTISMVDALQKANKQFEMMLYPGKEHSILGRTTRVNLFTKITEFLLKNL